MPKNNICILTILLLFTTCIEPFDPKIDDFDDILVIDGFLSNQTGPYTIKLSRTSSIRIPVFRSETGAQVIISDDLGNSEILNETSSGIYETSGNEIQGIIGRKYKLYIKTKDKNEYESDFVELPESVEIDTVYGVVDFQVSDDTGDLKKGYQFFTETQPNTNEYVNFLWEIIETYEYNAEYQIEEVYDTTLNSFVTCPNPQEFYKCWKTSRINNIFILKVNNGNNNIVSSLNFTTAESKKLLIKYSLLVNQYIINDEAYNYWSDLKKIMVQGNSLYNTQPFQVESNIKDINQENGPVIGYFTVAGVSQKRIFVDPMIPANLILNCHPSTSTYQTIVRWGSHSVQYAAVSHGGEMGVVSKSCVFCTAQGGVQEKPDYWDDNN